MKKIRLQSALLFLCIIFIRCISRSASLTPKESLLGVGPEDETYYTGLSSLGTINCKDGFKKFNKSQLNDDFCDCSDGSDEPGTSACPNGKFYCRNAGHVPLFIYSSRVNDGICDCCDGSDEYDGNIKCPNTCWEAGKMARDRLKKKITTYEEGVTIRKRNVEQAKLAIAKEEAELSKLQGEQKILDELVQQLREHKEQIEKAEEKELLQKVKEKKERKEAEEAEANDEDIEPVKNDINDKIGISSPPPQNAVEDNHDYIGKPEVSDHTIIGGYPNHGIEQMKKDLLQNAKQNEAVSFVDGKAGLETGSQEKDVAEDTESLSREELGRLVASRWTGEKTELQTEEADASKDDNRPNPDEIPNDTHDEEYNGYDSEDDEDRYGDGESDNQVDDFAGGGHDFSDNPESDDESDLLDITSTSNPSWLEKIQKTVRSIMQAVNLFQTPVNTSEAAHVLKEYDASSAKLSKIQSRISSLEQKLKHDLGQEKEFYSFYDQCFETKQNMYVYKICPFKQATQVEGHSRTRLGSWEKFEDSYRIMQFSNGDKCWNGPDRSLKIFLQNRVIEHVVQLIKFLVGQVKLRCGLKNEISDIDEPSRCEYLALLSTPALCLEDKLKELRDKLETMNKEQPHGHDEL